MVAHQDLVFAGGTATAVVLGLANGGAEKEPSAVSKLVGTLRDAAENANNPVVGEMVSKIADMIEHGQPAKKVMESIRVAREELRATGSDMAVSTALVKANKYGSEQLLKESNLGLELASGRDVSQKPSNEIFTKMLAEATRKFGEPEVPVMSDAKPSAPAPVVAKIKDPNQLA